MKNAAIVVCGLLLLASGASLVSGEDCVLIEAFVADLNAPAYEDRERATELLRHIGLPALPALKEALKADDEETRVRAEQLARDLRLGIDPEWPSSVILQVRHYDDLTEQKRIPLLQQLALTLREEAVPFMLARGATGTTNEAEQCLRCIRIIDTPGAARRVMACIRGPAGGFQTRALAWAYFRVARPMRAVEILAAPCLPPPEPDDYLQVGLDATRVHLAGKRYDQALAAARRTRRTAPQDSRPLYLEAEALAAQGQADDAADLRRKALAMNPDSATPHGTTALMLEEMERADLAALEWKAALEAGVPDEPATVAAALRLARIEATFGRPAAAADAIQKALPAVRRAAGGRREMVAFVGMAGDLEALVRHLRAQVAAFPDGLKPVQDVHLPDGELAAAVRVFVQDQKLDELRQGLGRVRANVRLEPTAASFPPLLDHVPSALRFDPQKGALQIVLKELPCSGAAPFDAEGKENPVAIHLLDRTYFYNVDAGAGTAHQIAAYEKDFVVTFEGGPELSAYAGLRATIDDRPYTWAEMRRGIAFDILPIGVTAVLEGVTPDGQRHRIVFHIRFDEPEIEPLEPGEEPEGPDIEGAPGVDV